MWIPCAASAFGVSPATLDLSGARGETIDATFTVINSSTAEQTYYLSTLAFGPNESSGAPEFIPYDVDHSGMPEWIAFPHAVVSIEANAKADVPFRVSIPAGAASGSYYAAVTVSTAPSEIVATNGATVEAKTAVLVFLTVEGETIEKAAVLDFVTPDGPITTIHELSYAFRVQNQGNVVVVPTASIVVTDLFGRTVFTKDANAAGGRVLPGTTRTFTDELIEKPSGFFPTVRKQWFLFAIGPMTATLVVDGADIADGPALHYWIVPWQLLSCIAVGLILLKLIWNGLTRRKA